MRKQEKVHKIPDFTVIGVADASLFPLLTEALQLRRARLQLGLVLFALLPDCHPPSSGC